MRRDAAHADLRRKILLYLPYCPYFLRSKHSQLLLHLPQLLLLLWLLLPELLLRLHRLPL